MEHIGSDMAQAFQELAKGEKTASALESRLTDIESRIDQLLASIDKEGDNDYDSQADKTAGNDITTASGK